MAWLAVDQEPIVVGSLNLTSASSFNIAVAGTYTMTVQVRDQYGDLLTRAPSFSSSDVTKATVNSSTGVVTGVAAGSVTILATSGGQTTSVTGTVTASQNAVASVTILQGATASVVQGGGINLNVVVKDAGGATLPGKTVVWSDNNTNTSFTADSGDPNHQTTVTGVSVGTSTITATCGAFSANCVVTVQVASSLWPNQPPNLIAQTEWDFTSLTSRPARWIRNAGYLDSIQSDPLAPHSPPFVGEALFTTSFPTAGSGACWWEYNFVAALKRVYLAYWIWLSPAFECAAGATPATGTIKTHFINTDTSGSAAGAPYSGYAISPAAGQAFGALNGGRTSPISFAIGLQGLAQVPAFGLWAYANLGASPLMTRGGWHFIEVAEVANTPGVADGSLDWALNGVPCFHASGIMWTWTGGVSKFPLIKINTTLGGSGWPAGTHPTAPMALRFDDIYTSGSLT